ncbi:hypothetical protein CDD83_1248 [Cordyceps sp. RAO-2017]|nr:hypothetical protein CDD83_1248 [Cordyceps sp. RAO-2017]
MPNRQPLPFHANHIGSLIRPAALSELQARADDSGDSAAAAELAAAQRAAIADIVAKQRARGVRPLTSGELDRRYYFAGFFEKLDGFRQVSPVPWELARAAAPPVAALRRAGRPYPMAAVCEAKIGYGRSPYLDNWRMLRDAVPEPLWPACKFTMPPPCFFHLRLAPGRCYSPAAYADDAAFFADLAAAYRRELRALHAAGLRLLQIDDPTLAYFCSDDMLRALRRDGVDPDLLLDRYIRAHNDCIADRPDGLHVGLHICRGNFAQSMHFSEGSYERIAQRLFTSLDYDTFLLEYDSPRAGGFEPLRFLPAGKSVVLGVATTKDPGLEDAEAIKERVREAARIIAEGQGRSVDEVMKSIGISPQCGFASVAVGADGMTEERMFAKLDLIRSVARDLWPEDE